MIKPKILLYYLRVSNFELFYFKELWKTNIPQEHNTRLIDRNLGVEIFHQSNYRKQKEPIYYSFIL